MKRRHFLGTGLLGGALAPQGRAADLCGCSLFAQAAATVLEDPMAGVGSGVKITGMKVFGVSLTPDSDRPYVFVKLETNAGRRRLGRRHARRQGGRGDGLHQRLPRVPHRQRSDAGGASLAVDVCAQLLSRRSGDRLGDLGHRPGAVGHPRQGARACRSTSCWADPSTPAACAAIITPSARTPRGTAASCARRPSSRASRASSPASPATTSGSRRTHKIERAVKRMQMLREGLGPDIDIGVDFHAKTSPSVASIIVKEVEPLNLLFIEEPCPPENVQAMARIAKRSTTPIATGERLIASLRLPRADRDGRGRHPADRHQPRGRHHRACGRSARWPTLPGSRWRRTPAKARSAALATRPRRCGDAELPGPGDLQRRRSRSRRRSLGGVAGFPAMRMVNGRFPLPEKPGLGSN